MPSSGKMGLVILLLSTVAISTSCGEDQIQEVSYSLVEGWAELPEGVEAWGQTIGVEIDTEVTFWSSKGVLQVTALGEMKYQRS